MIVPCCLLSTQIRFRGTFSITQFLHNIWLSKIHTIFSPNIAASFTFKFFQRTIISEIFISSNTKKSFIRSFLTSSILKQLVFNGSKLVLIRSHASITFFLCHLLSSNGLTVSIPFTLLYSVSVNCIGTCVLEEDF